MLDTLTAPAPTVTPEALPDLDDAIGHAIGDEILLASAASTKVAKVKAGQARAESRAWSFGGNVD